MTIDPEKKKKMLSYRWMIFIVLAIAYFFVYFHRTTGEVRSPQSCRTSSESALRLSRFSPPPTCTRIR